MERLRLYQAVAGLSTAIVGAGAGAGMAGDAGMAEMVRALDHGDMI